MSIDLSYLKPPHEASLIIHSPSYIFHGEKKKSTRKIFHNVEFTDFEKERMNDLANALEKDGYVLPDSWTERNLLLLVYAGDFVTKKSVQAFKKLKKVTEDPAINTLSESGRKSLEEGLVYTFGRDTFFRPIVILRGIIFHSKTLSLDTMLNALYGLMESVRKHMFLPGKIENWIVIFDLSHLSLWSIPLKKLKKVINFLKIIFTSTLEKLIIFNPPKIVSLSWSIVEKLIHPETVKKLSFVTKAHHEKLRDIIDENQLEERFGGKHPDLTTYFPPINTIKSDFSPKDFGVGFSDSSEPFIRTERIEYLSDPIKESQNSTPMNKSHNLEDYKVNPSQKDKQEEILVMKATKEAVRKNSLQFESTPPIKNNKGVTFQESTFKPVAQVESFSDATSRLKIESNPSMQKFQLHLPLDGFDSPLSKDKSPLSNKEVEFENKPPKFESENAIEFQNRKNNSKGGCCGTGSKEKCCIF